MNRHANSHFLGPDAFTAHLPMTTLTKEQVNSLIYAFDALNGPAPQRSWLDRVFKRNTDLPKRHLPEKFYISNSVVTFVFASDAPVKKDDILIMGQLTVLKNTVEMDPYCTIHTIMPRDLAQGETRVEIIAREVAYGYRDIEVFAEFI